MTWDNVPIGTIISSSQYGLSILADPSGNIPIVGMKDIRAGRVYVDQDVRVKLSDEESKDYILSDGDILLNRTNSPDLVGKAGIYRGTNKAVFASYLVRIELKRDLVDPDFVIQILNSDLGQRHIKKLATRAVSQANLNPTTFKKHFLIPLPKIREQQAIRDVFFAWDTAIEKSEKLITVKEKSFAGLVYVLISKACRKWKHLRTNQLFQSVSEKDNGQEELLSVTQDRGAIPRSMLNGRVMSPAGSTEGYKLVKEGDFVISLRSFQGGIEYSRYRGLISPAYTVLRPLLNVNNDFYRYFFKSYLFIEKYLSVAVIGIRDGKQISIPDFMNVKIPYPGLQIQTKIATVLNTARHEIDVLRQQVEAYHIQKRGLMQKLLAGEWRVGVSREKR